MIKKNEPELNFEQAFSRLEEILEQMNAGKATLDESLKLYEEADRLISQCSNRLTFAERRIEVLIKNRSGEVQLSANGTPSTQEFSSHEESASLASSL